MTLDDESAKMLWFNKIFKKQKPQVEHSTAQLPVFSGNEEVPPSFRNLIPGYELCVTLNLGTPLEWLERDHEKADKPQPVPMHLGVWTPILKKSRFSYAGTRASVFGQVPFDGGEVLIFLKKYRSLIEGDAELSEMRSELIQLQSEHQVLVSRVTDDLPAYYFCERLQADLRCGPRTARKLYDAGYINSAKVRSARSEELLSIPGVGQKTIARFSKT